MRKIITLTLFLLVTLMVNAQLFNPVKFTSELKTNGTADAEIVFTGKIEKGWHVYSTNLGQDGPTEATFNVNRIEGIKLVGKMKAIGHEIAAYDKNFEMNLRFFESNVRFVQKIKFTKPTYSIDVYLNYGACSDQTCMRPMDVNLKQSGKSPAVDGKAVEEAKAAGTKDAITETAPSGANMAAIATDTLALSKADTTAQAAISAAIPSDADKAALWKPVIKEQKAFGGAGDIADQSLLYIFLMGIVGGLLALVMPCIWPIIPMTVSFFLKRSKDNRRRGVRDAAIYGASIVVIFLTLGIGVTARFGPSTLNALSTNAVFNIFLFALLVVFALSFFGWFEIKLPDSWANKVDTKASNTTGLLSIFLMAFTLVLVSFSCTAPIIGLLLVQTVTSGARLAPAIGMLGFALALAVPFSLFAMFPSLMKRTPKSGVWMNHIKVVLGFIELAFALKFFSVADLAYGWHLMDREVFLSIWIVIFGALGAYLVGWLKFPHDAIEGDTNKPMSVPAIMTGLCSFAFAVYMIPGLWGAPCKAVSAFAPPMNTQDFNLDTKVVEARFTDYETGMTAARAAGKPVLIDFTGFGCVNCRKMEAAVWTDPSVADKLENDYVLISLYVDDKTKLPQPIEVKDENGRTRTLRTVGDRWSYLQSHKFGANTQPFYVAVDSQGNPLNGAYSYNENIKDYLNFLDKGLENFKRRIRNAGN